MENFKYANLHHKTHYSCGIAIGTCEDSILAAKNNELSALAITDYCSISGALEFLKEGQKQEFPVIVGSEINYVDEWNQIFNIVLLIKNNVGYHNLCRLITYAHQNAQKYNKPACLLSDLRDFSDGLVCLAGGALGPWSQYWIKKDMIDSPKAKIEELLNIFKDDFYLEFNQSNQMYQWDSKHNEYIQKYDDNPHKFANKALIKFSDETGIKCIITSDSYIPNEEDKILQDVVVRTSPKGKQGFYFRETRPILRSEELEARIAVEHIGISHKRLGRYFSNTLEIAEKCQNPIIKFKDQVVQFPITTHTMHQNGMDKNDLLWEIIRSNGRIDLSNKEQMDRLSYEIKAIKDNGRIDLLDYFLVVEDLVRACRDNGVVVGPGRGSGAGSLLNYALKITHLDPLKYGLLFERFISEGRIQKGSLPDIDLDFSDQKWAKNYLGEKYGWDRVMPIGTFQTMQTKSSIKDAFKLFYPHIEFKVVNKITNKFGKKDESETEVEFFQRSLESDESIKIDLFKTFPKAGECVERLIGFNRQTGIHPCGIAITQDKLEGIAPGRSYKDKMSLDFDGNTCEQAGVIKYDILSLSTLKYIGTAVKLIKDRHDIDIDIYELPTEDPKVWKAFDRGQTDGVFQFGSNIAKGILTKVKSKNLEDGSMVTSVGRPGPMANDQHLEFIKRSNGEHDSIPPHPKLAEVLKETYGIMIYQESVMKASQILGGFSLAEADDIRKAMGKKKRKILIPYKKRFIENCVRYYDPDGGKYRDFELDQIADEGGHTDISPERAEYLWHLMETFSGYGFNKSHAVCYAYIGYICQYLKVYYPLEWWCSCLHHSVSKPDKFSEYFQAAQDLILLPDINHSTNNFYIRGDKIQFPFNSIKGVGVVANAEIEKNRPYTSIDDFYKRVYKRVINKGVFEKLIFADCFQSWGNFQDILKHYYEELRGEKIPEKYLHLNKEQKLNLRAKALDFIVLDYYDIYPDVFNDPDFLIRLEDLKNTDQGQKVKIGGKVTERKIITTKRKKEKMAKIVIQNGRDTARVTIWPKEFAHYDSKIQIENVVKIEGTIDYFNNQPQILSTHILTLEEALRQKAQWSYK